MVICEQMKGAFEKKTDISVNMVRLSSGETYAKIRAEARNPKTDIWWAGTGDPHLQAASEGLTLEYKSPMLGELHEWAVKQAESAGYRTVGVYAGALGWGYNTEIFKQKNLKEPKCWADLLDPSFKGEVQIANPNSSGTAYTALATLVQIMGEDEAFDYLKKLNANVSQYTKSGSAPVKAAARGNRNRHRVHARCGRADGGRLPGEVRGALRRHRLRNRLDVDHQRHKEPRQCQEMV